MSRKILLAICLPVLAVVIIAAAVVGAVLGTEGNKRLTAGNLADSTTSVSSTTINLGSTKIDANSKSAVQELINYVSGSSSNVSYTTLNTNMESWKGVGSLSSTTTKTKVANQFTTKTVTLGGIVWNVMYVSKADYTANGTTAGDIIVTLWQSSVNTSYTSKYSSTAVNSPDDTYPSNMYGASYIRSTLVGSTYSTNRTSLNATGVQNSHWKPFTTTSSSTVNGYAEVLATPANMKWQETEDPKITMGFANHYPNDAWGKVSTGGSYATWSSNSNGSMNYYDNASTTYPSWRNDKIWLPSMTETGWGATNTNRYGVAGSGIWNATADMRKTGSTGTLTQYAWLRSGAYSGAGSAMVLKNDGTSGRTDYNLTKEYAVRPAIHLNLKAAAKASGLLTQSITYHTSYGTAPANGTYTIGSTTNLSAPTNIPTGLTFNGWVKGSYAGTTKVTSLSGQTEALDLYATFNLTAATVTTTPSNKAASITSDASTTLSATFSHPYITNKEATVSTYWRYNDGTANLATATGMTVTNGATPSVAFSNPARTRSGKYTLYYALTPTTAAANKGLKALATQKAADFTLTVTEPIKYFTSYGTAPAKGSYTPGSSSLPALGSVTNIPAGYAFRGWAKGSYSGAVITTLSGQTTALDLYATFTPTAGTITTTPANKAVTITYGAGAAMSAEITHSLVTSGDATVTTYWRKSGENTDIATGNGITVVNGEHPSLTFAKPTRSMAGTYVLYYSLTTTAAAKAKGLFDRAAGEAARYTLTINKADLSVSTLPTITPPTGSDKLYIGQSISATKLTGGVVHCASANDNNVAGTWAITTTGVYTSYGKITAKFTPTDTENLNTLTGVEITTNAIQLYLRVQEDVSGIFDRVLTPKPAANIAVDYGSSIGFSISDDKFTFMVRQNGTVNNVDYAINEHSGFTSFMHLAADTEKEELTANSPELTNVTTDKLFTIAYIGADTAYTVYYLLDGTDSGYPEGSTAADFNALISGGSQYVYKSELTGATGRRVKYMSNGKPLNASLAARADIDQRVLDEEKTGEIKVVSSDG
ncbi:MAG: hypothetical protein K2K04_01220, partial [Clostridia bacterium]|nr:hypothetical protein [Clostridia bacterium]